MVTTATTASGRWWLVTIALMALVGCDGGAADPNLDGDPALRGQPDGGGMAGAGGALAGSGGSTGAGGSAASSVGGHQGSGGAGVTGAGGASAGAGGSSGGIAVCDPATGYQITSDACYDSAGQLQHHSGFECNMCGSLLGAGQFCVNRNGALCVRLCSDCK
jgi:hypothetical protein